MVCRWILENKPAVLAAKMRPPRRGPNPSVPSTAMFFLTKNVCEKETSKNTLQGGTAVSGCQNGTVPEQGEVHLAYSLFANFIENDFKTKLRKIRLSEVPQFLAAKIGPSRSRAKSTYPIVSLQISLKTIEKKKRRKK